MKHSGIREGWRLLLRLPVFHFIPYGLLANPFIYLDSGQQLALKRLEEHRILYYGNHHYVVDYLEMVISGAACFDKSVTVI